MRARITIPSMVFAVMSLGFLAALYPVFHDSFQANLDSTSTATEWLLVLILPLAVLVLISTIFAKATEGT